MEFIQVRSGLLKFLHLDSRFCMFMNHRVLITNSRATAFKLTTLNVGEFVSCRVIYLIDFLGSWFITKLIPRKSHLNETLHFLLDHPRRCYTYLFPSHQTWFLLTIVFLLTYVLLCCYRMAEASSSSLSAIDWFFFMVLDIGNTVIEDIPLNTRFAAGLFQAVAVRAAGFSIVPMNSLAPAVK